MLNDTLSDNLRMRDSEQSSECQDLNPPRLAHECGVHVGKTSDDQAQRIGRGSRCEEPGEIAILVLKYRVSLFPNFLFTERLADITRLPCMWGADGEGAERLAWRRSFEDFTKRDFEVFFGFKMLFIFGKVPADLQPWYPYAVIIKLQSDKGLHIFVSPSIAKTLKNPGSSVRAIFRDQTLSNYLGRRLAEFPVVVCKSTGKIGDSACNTCLPWLEVAILKSP